MEMFYLGTSTEGGDVFEAAGKGLDQGSHSPIPVPAPGVGTEAAGRGLHVLSTQPAEFNIVL